MSFARSLNKAQGFLMPYRRPTFGRTLSNSSELSLTSNTSGRDEDVGGDAVPSAPGTPVLAPTENPFFAKRAKGATVGFNGLGLAEHTHAGVILHALRNA
ncbi:hypothetical protein MY3957_005695 [Beauveria namnaoensis]